MKKNDNHLPIYGVGPIYGVVIIAFTVIACILSAAGILNRFKLQEGKCKMVVIIEGLG